MQPRYLLVLLIVTTQLTAGCLGGSKDDGSDSAKGLPYGHDFILAANPQDMVDVRQFTTIDPATGENLTQYPWAIFDREYGGNCCEHYLASTEEGWLTNLGGEYVWWTEDRGKTWSEYRPHIVQDESCRDPMITLPSGEGLGEGSIIQTHDGDIIAMGWYPYPSWDAKADRFYAFLYDNEADEWRWCYNQWHEPFYDRSWQVEIPGPITSNWGSSPWASLVISNFWHQSGDLGGTLSLDGLNYLPFDFPNRNANLDTLEFDLNFENLTDAWDYLTPHREMRAMPVPTGGLLFPRYFSDGTNAFLDTHLDWYRHEVPEGTQVPFQHLTIDSSGALHSLGPDGLNFTHHVSFDGGATWQNNTIILPNAASVEEWDFQSDGNLDLAVLAVRYGTDDFDKDVLFHIRNYHESLVPDAMTWIGQGDLDATSGAGNDVRFDFASLAILTDGGVVMAYADTSSPDPLFAVEMMLPPEYLN